MCSGISPTLKVGVFLNMLQKLFLLGHGWGPSDLWKQLINSCLPSLPSFYERERTERISWGDIQSEKRLNSILINYFFQEWLVPLNMIPPANFTELESLFLGIYLRISAYSRGGQTFWTVVHFQNLDEGARHTT